MSRSTARVQSPLTYAAVGASILAVPGSAAAIAGATHQSGSNPPIKAKVKRSRVEYGGEVIVVGMAPASAAGETITLQYSSTATHGWKQVASARIRDHGRFRLVAWLRRSGWLMASIAPQAGSARVSPFVPSSAAGSSAPERVAVAAAVRVWPRSVNQLTPRPVLVRGVLRPNTPGRRVVLQADRSGRWITVARSFTDSQGWFKLRYRPEGLGRAALRVRFAGDSVNAAVSRSAGSVTVYHPTVASWYYDGGTTACGFHAYYGVANLSLPCGAQVSFFAGGRVVRAVVDDRGPYVGGRTWDLNQNTAAALGVAGVVTVWSSQ